MWSWPLPCRIRASSTRHILALQVCLKQCSQAAALFPPLSLWWNAPSADRVHVDRSDAEKKALPFFLYAFADEDIIVARGRSGGMALWVYADAEWQAKAGVLQVFK